MEHIRKKKVAHFLVVAREELADVRHANVVVANDLLLDRPGRHQRVHLDGPALPHPVGTADGLLSESLVQKGLKKDYPVGGGEVDANPTSPCRKQEDGFSLIRLEGRQALFSFRLRHAAREGVHGGHVLKRASYGRHAPLELQHDEKLVLVCCGPDQLEQRFDLGPKVQGWAIVLDGVDQKKVRPCQGRPAHRALVRGSGEQVLHALVAKDVVAMLGHDRNIKIAEANAAAIVFDRSFRNVSKAWRGHLQAHVLTGGGAGQEATEALHLSKSLEARVVPGPPVEKFHLVVNVVVLNRFVVAHGDGQDGAGARWQGY